MPFTKVCKNTLFFSNIRDLIITIHYDSNFLIEI